MTSGVESFNGQADQVNRRLQVPILLPQAYKQGDEFTPISPHVNFFREDGETPSLRFHSTIRTFPMKHNCKTLFAVMIFSGLSALAHSSSLEEIYQQALKNDHTYKAAQANLEAGRENAKLGLAGLLPKANARAEWKKGSGSQSGLSANNLGVLSPMDRDTDTTSQGYSISVEQPLFNMAAWYSFKRGKTGTSIAESQFKVAEQSLILRSAQAYFDALQAVDNLETAMAEENALSHQLEQTRQRFEVGLTAITEVHEAQAVYDSALAERMIAEGRVGIAFEALEVITGQPHTELAPLKENLPVTLPSPQERSAWVDMAMQNNYKLKIASLSADAAKQKAKVQKAGHYPTLSGNFSYSDYDSDAESNGITTSDVNDKGQSIGVTLSIPIFNGGSISASRRQAAYEWIAAKEELNQAQRDIVQSTRSVHLSVTTGVTTVKARAQAITSNQSALEATQAGYDVGTRDLVDVLNAQRNLYLAQRNYYDALYAYIISTLELKQAAGILSATDITELNSWLDMRRKAA